MENIQWYQRNQLIMYMCAVFVKHGKLSVYVKLIHMVIIPFFKQSHKNNTIAIKFNLCVFFKQLFSSY